MALGLFHEDPLWSYAGLLREIKELGATHVSLTLAYYQEHGGSTTLYAHPRFSAPDQTLLRTVRAAHALGLAVMIFPIVRLENPRSLSEWRGTLKPEDPAAWWQSYERLLLHLAELSAREKVALLCIGSVLSALGQAGDRAGCCCAFNRAMAPWSTSGPPITLTRSPAPSPSSSATASARPRRSSPASPEPDCP